MSESPDLGTVQGRRKAILDAVCSRPMSLVDICRSLGLERQPERARMRTALNHLERSSIIEVDTERDGRPITFGNSIVYRPAKGAFAKAPVSLRAPDATLPVRAARAPVPLLPSPSTVESDATSSMRRCSATTNLTTLILPGMGSWENLGRIAARTGLADSSVREAIRAGLHEYPPLVLGWTPSGAHPTQRLGSRCFYLPASLFGALGFPITGEGDRHREQRLAAILEGADTWQTPSEISARTGIDQREVYRLLREDASSPKPSFATWSKSEGRGEKHSFHSSLKFLPVSLLGRVKLPRRRMRRHRMAEAA